MTWIEEEEYIELIIQYIDELEQPKRDWPRYYYDRQCIIIWAAEEVYDYVLHHPEITPLNAIRRVSDTFYDYASIDHKRKEVADIFSIAYDTSIDMQQFLINNI